MKEKELNAFLASVRRTRFVDYLDPLGETAQNALERRLSWARVSQHDPAYAGEARFLLDNAEGLRDVLRRELEEDDWVEEADVGREWETREEARSSRMRENDRVTEIFQADDLEVSSAPQKVQVRPTKGGAPLPPSPRSTPRPSTPQPASRSVAVSEAQAPPRVPSRTLSPGEPPRGRAESDVRRSGEPPRQVDTRARTSEPPRRGAETAPRGVETARRVEPPRSPTPSQTRPNDRSSDRVNGDTTGARPIPGSAGRTAPGALGRSATPGPSSRAPSSSGHRSTPGPTPRSGGAGYGQATGSSPYSPAVGDSLPPLQDTRDTRDTRAPPTSNPPVSKPRSDYGSGRSAGIGRGRNEPPPRGGGQRSPSRDGRPGGRIEDENTSPLSRQSGPAPSEVDFDDWDAPDDPVSTTGIMRLEDVNPRPQQEIVIGVDNLETVTVMRPPRAPVAASVVLEETSTGPSAVARLRRPPGGETPYPDSQSGAGSHHGSAGKRAAVMASMPMPRVRASVDPAPRRSRVLPLLIGLSLMALVLVVVGGVVIVPLVYTQTDFGRSEAVAPEVVVVAPQPEPVVLTPEPAVVAPVELVAADPAVPGSQAMTSVASAVPPVIAPAPAPAPQPAEAPVPAPKPAKPPPPAPEPAPAPAPRSSAPPVDVSGLWIGSTSTASSFKLTVLGQTDGDFEGTVEVQVEDGTFTSLAITGKVDGNGLITFRNGAASFNGKVTGRKVSGTYTLAAGATPVSWSAVH